MLNPEHQGIGMTSQRTRDRLVERLREQGISNEAVLAQIGSVPRHIFIDEALAHRAYEDTALPIGLGQTISQPFIVALMTEKLLLHSPKSVLEIGTGCGYQTAILAGLVPSVHSVELIPELAARARQNLRTLKLSQIRTKTGDGYAGWSAYAPYDAIIVTAAPPEVPQELLSQLSEGGRMVIPVGEAQQSLRVIDRTSEGFTESVEVGVRFVPLVPGS